LHFEGDGRSPVDDGAEHVEDEGFDTSRRGVRL
jgi:hypothetical protein